MRCKDCIYFSEKEMRCSIKEGSSLRKCVIAINKEFVLQLSKIKKKVSVLEIGCGSWSYLKENLPSNVEWFGIDPLKVKDGKKVIVTKIGSVEKIPYKSNSFDFVFSNQSIEHWYEYGVTFDVALFEISRVLKKNGELHLNAPIYLHGHIFFLTGNMSKILNVFHKEFWKVKRVKEWRKDFEPLTPFRGWMKNKLVHSVIDEKLINSSWILNLIFVKKRTQNFLYSSKLYYLVYKLYYYVVPRNIRLVSHYGVKNAIVGLLKYGKKS